MCSIYRAKQEFLFRDRDPDGSLFLSCNSLLCLWFHLSQFKLFSEQNQKLTCAYFVLHLPSFFPPWTVSIPFQPCSNNNNSSGANAFDQLVCRSVLFFSLPVNFPKRAEKKPQLLLFVKRKYVAFPFPSVQMKSGNPHICLSFQITAQAKIESN